MRIQQCPVRGVTLRRQRPVSTRRATEAGPGQMWLSGQVWLCGQAWLVSVLSVPVGNRRCVAISMPSYTAFCNGDTLDHDGTQGLQHIPSRTSRQGIKGINSCYNTIGQVINGYPRAATLAHIPSSFVPESLRKGKKSTYRWQSHAGLPFSPANLSSPPS
ncbi:hypothetical protein EV126DRAFT_6965 [Verticillium dahliae]|nr:hypothetical protein EV126DRAFT_6965 [Verticillium dahliae]